MQTLGAETQKVPFPKLTLPFWEHQPSTHLTGHRASDFIPSRSSLPQWADLILDSNLLQTLPRAVTRPGLKIGPQGRLFYTMIWAPSWPLTLDGTFSIPKQSLQRSLKVGSKPTDIFAGSLHVLSAGL